MYKVYTLSLISKPHLVRYIGITKTTLNQRLSQHKCLARKENNHRAKWILKNMNDIQITEIDSCNSFTEVNFKEVEYIKIYKALGAKLINSTIGGGGILGYKHCSNTINKIKTARAKQVFSEESKQKMSLSQIEYNKKEDTYLKSRRVKVKCFKENELHTFNSITECANFLKRNVSTVHEAILRNGLCNKYKVEKQNESNQLCIL